MSLQTLNGFFSSVNYLSGGGVNANHNAKQPPSLACKNKTEKIMTLDCSRIAKEIMMISGLFVEGKRQE